MASECSNYGRFSAPVPGANVVFAYTVDSAQSRSIHGYDLRDALASE
ncbi:MAG: hypothetical protein R2684_14165 [Pyrinomonadaceae bacterium]